MQMQWPFRILMCRPKYYGVEYRINPWMNLKNNVDQSLKFQQWKHLHHLIIRLGGYVEYVLPQPGLPDMVFTANSALIKGNKAVMSSFRHRERRGEEKYFSRFFEKIKDIEQLIFVTDDFTNQSYFEGAGDALFAGDVLFAGYNIRSAGEVYEHIKEFLDLDKLVMCELVDEYFYHLDTCFCPLGEEHAIFYPNAFSNKSEEAIRSSINAIPIIKEEAKKFACNAVVLGENIVMPSGCPKTIEILNQLGYNVYTCDMCEYIKAGGACKCLTLDITSLFGE